MERFCQGDRAAFDTLYGRYVGPLLGFLTRLAGNPSAAEDLVQSSFLSVVRSRGRFTPGARFRPWLYAIATNAARDLARRQRSQELTPEGELPAAGLATEMALRDVGLERRVQQALAILPEGQRLPILMHRFEGMSFSEVAEAMGLTETAVKVRAHRGYTRLRELLADLKEEG
jgi:RNA polymerase sigma factor (sigma-70 family)